MSPADSAPYWAFRKPFERDERLPQARANPPAEAVELSNRSDSERAAALSRSERESPTLVSGEPVSRLARRLAGHTQESPLDAIESAGKPTSETSAVERAEVDLREKQ